MTGKFVFSSGQGWIGIDYVSESVGMTMFIRPNTDLGVIDCQEAMERIERMTEQEKQELVMRRIRL